MNDNTIDPLYQILDEASKTDLRELLEKLTFNNAPIYKECLEFLIDRVNVQLAVKESAESSVVMALWCAVEPDLEKLDVYGGGSYSTEERVRDILYEISEKLDEVSLTEDDRSELLSQVLSYIKSGNAGMDDSLYDIAYAMCENEHQWRELARLFEDLKKSWPTDHARRIYRSIGDNKNYLRLRLNDLHYGMAYYDLATFYWEIGDKKKAVDTARKGMEDGNGRLSDLRMFLAERAQDSGNRGEYLDYVFAEKTNPLKLSSYDEFKEECTPDEWKKYEPKILEMLKKNVNIEAVKIYLSRNEYKAALQYFLNNRGRNHFYYSDVYDIAAKLESLFPEEILKFYKSAVGNLNMSATRKNYAQNAIAVRRVQRVIVEVMKKTEEWLKYAQPIKANNSKRPAFQDEFSKVVRGWDLL